MTHPFIGTWRAEANPRAFLRFGEDHTVHGSDGINRLVSTWDEDGTIASAGRGEGSTSAGKGEGSGATIRPAMTTLMATPNLQAWVTSARRVEVRDDALVLFDIQSQELGTLRRDAEAE